MQVGLMLPYLDTSATGEGFRRWCEFVDAGPFSTISCGERVVFDNLDGLTLLSFAAAVTSRVGLTSAVTVLPMHPTAVFAKRAATIDHLSGGRLTIGIGAGERPEDYRASERPMTRRYQRTGEQIADLRAIWSGENSSEDHSKIGPTPRRPGGLRLLSGAYGPRALARSAQWADGFVGGSAWEDERVVMMGEGRHRLTVTNWLNAWEVAERQGTPHIVGLAWFTLVDDGPAHMLEFGSKYFSSTDGTPHVFSPEMAPYVDEDSVRKALDDFEDAGFDELLLMPPTTALSELERLQRIVESR